MMTDEWTPQGVNPDIGDRFIDTSYTRDGAAPTTGGSAKPRPTPGAYVIQALTVVTRFVEAKEWSNDRGSGVFPAHIEAEPNFVIVSAANGDDTFAGTPLNKYYRLTSEAVRKGGQVLNYSTLSSALDAFGLALPEGGRVDDVLTAAESMSGLTSTRPVYLSYAGQYKRRNYVKMPNNTYLRFNEKAFRLGDPNMRVAQYIANGGTWALCGFLLDADDPGSRAWTLERPSENMAHAKVWANVEPTEDGFLGRR